MALILRNGGSQSPDRWLKEPRNNHLPDGTKKTGIGNFIRVTSLDEFPQFFNVLKGDMSIVGTRPPTLDEWNKYELHHRARLDEQFNPDRPNAVWCSDITYIWTIDGFVYLTSVMDLFSRKIIAWTFSETLEVSCMIDTINNIVKTPEGAAVDNDGQLTSINAESYASMNMWGLTPEFMQILENGFKEFFANMGDKDIEPFGYLIPLYEKRNDWWNGEPNI